MHNYMADVLSQLPIPSNAAAIEDDKLPELTATIAALSCSLISVDAIRHHTEQDALLMRIITKSIWSAKKHLEPTLFLYYHIRDELSVEEDCLTRAEH